MNKYVERNIIYSSVVTSSITNSYSQIKFLNITQLKPTPVVSL